jgi:transcriptional regulator with XRE-family HTH domain
MSKKYGGIRMGIGLKIKILREERGLSQKQLADKLNISRPAVTKYERDEREPNYDILLKLADYFGVSTDFLLGKTNEKDKNTHSYNKNIKRLENINLNDFSYGDETFDLIQESAIRGLLAKYISNINPDNPWALDWIYLSTILFDAVEKHCLDIFNLIHETMDNDIIYKENIDNKTLIEIQKGQRILISIFNEVLEKIKEMTFNREGIYFINEITETFKAIKGEEYIKNREGIYDLFKNIRTKKVR